MMIYCIAALLFLLLFLLTVKEKPPKEIIPKSPYHLFAKMAYGIYRMILALKSFLQNHKKGVLYLNYEKSISDSLVTLSPGKDKAIGHAKYYVEKISICLLILFVGLLLSAAITGSSGKKSVIHDGAIERKEYEEGKRKVDVSVTNEDGSTEDLTIVVSDMMYTREQMDQLFYECLPLLEASVLGENKELSYITTDLSFIKKLKGYPFSIRWKSGNHKIIKNSGEIVFENLTEEGSVVVLEATLTYEEYEYFYEFCCQVFPKELSENEQFCKDVNEALKEADDSTITEERYYLPQSVNGKDVVWKEKIKDNGKIIFLFFLFVGILLFFLKDKDLKTKLEIRKEEMMIDYPEIVSKMTLLVGAGMTVRTAWKKIVTEYCQRKEKGEGEKYAYEEMLFTIREVEAGISEVVAYDRFGKRCGIQQYVKFASLLSQNLRKGTGGLRESLEQEAQEALQSQRTNARIKGEKAGTKLLVPMMLMLLIVLMMIVIPAFSSF